MTSWWWEMNHPTDSTWAVEIQRSWGCANLLPPFKWLHILFTPASTKTIKF